MNTITQGLAVAIAMIAAALAVSWGAHKGLLGADASFRGLMVANALLLAYYGNAIPKAVLRSAALRAGRRFAGWVFVLAGLISAALWAFAPLDVATPAAISVIAAAIVLASGYCFLSRSKTAGSS